MTTVLWIFSGYLLGIICSVVTFTLILPGWLANIIYELIKEKEKEAK